ncbi:MAG: Hint domain-containing protein [Acidocella sp.]|nr:Hint domain-containing protein [Acidocella sp.]
MSGTTISTTLTSGLQLGVGAQNAVLVEAGGAIEVGGTVAGGLSLATAVYGSAAESWNIVNAGTLSASVLVPGLTPAPFGTGIRLQGGGEVTNTSSGLIYGAFGGVLLQGDGTVVNAGSIGAADNLAGRYGVGLGGGGSVVNAGVISGYDGIWSGGGQASVENSGVVVGGAMLQAGVSLGGYTFAGGAGVLLEAGGVVRNTGTILGGNLPVLPIYHAGMAGTGVSLASGALANAGSIGGGDATGYKLDGGSGVAASAAVLANTGRITGGAAYDGGVGVVASDSYFLNQAIVVGGAGSNAGGAGVLQIGGVMVNQGSISGGTGGGWAWVRGLDAGVDLYTGLLRNYGVISGGEPQRVGLDIGTGTAQNSGTIIGNAAVVEQSGLLTNTGVIQGEQVGVDIAGGVLVNAGTVSGTFAVYMGFSASLLEVAPGAVFYGAVVDHATVAGTLALEAGDGTLNMGGSFSGFSEIAFAQGAAWTLEGDAAELAAGQSIIGFSGADTLVLGGFTATSDAYVAGTGLVLSDGTVTETLAVASEPFTISAVAAGTQIVICYLRGTRIMTAQGEVPVEALCIGDELPVQSGGMRRIKWIGRQSFSRTADRRVLPVRIRAGTLGGGRPWRDLFVSPGHSMLLEGRLVLAAALLNGVTVTQDERTGPLDYYLMEFGQHDCVLAEGAWSESFADAAGLRGRFHNAETFYALYPDHVAPEEPVLCAPRPTRGPELAAVLAPVVARAAGLAEPGALRGVVDIAAGRLVEGWAQDLTWPELPQLLELSAAERVLGRVLACDYRADLHEAGIGAGRCHFSFTAPEDFRPEALRVRRVGDGSSL